ncbi:integrating conjugative element protein [Delftia acidovorans CCUG 274B]|uniref:DUF3262 family protein n=1 Tax=Delftia TaxID=80865 RepID=UPI0003539CC2|nr:DUF3262 family protein [Delftia acidovorans]EPD42960.1 integrating conjugative element protein [Delftia acidovorans CCUG 274B]
MFGDMKAGFMDASGVDPARMKVFVITLVFGVILVIAAWFGKMIMEAYSEGEIEQSDAIESIITVIVIVSLIFGFVAWL